MKKLLFLPLIVFTLLFDSCAVKNPMTEGKKPVSDDMTSLRKHLAYLGWRFLPLTENKTLISYYDWSGRSVFRNRLEKALTDFCKANGGEALATVCRGGNNPFTSETFKGFSKYYRSTGTYYSLYFTIVKTKKPDIDIDYGFFDNKVIEKAKNQTLDQFLKENSGFASPFSEFKHKNNTYSFIVYTNNPNPPGELNGKNFEDFWLLIEFCKAHGGKIYWENKNYSSKGYFPFDYWAEVIVKRYKGKTFNSYIINSSEKYPLNGTYVCKSKNQPFYFHIRGYMTSNALGGFASYKVTLKKGLPSDFKQSSKIKVKTTDVKISNEIKNSLRDKLALEAAIRNSIIIERKGPSIYKGVYCYNDENDCKIVAVMRVFKKSQSKV